MKTLVDQLAQYAAYHRDRRNIATHFVGIPMIVLAVSTLLARPAFDIAGIALSPALLVALATVLYYLKLDVRYGLVMTAFMALMVWGGERLATGTTASWLVWGIGLFVIGWIIQFVGHYYEGRKPAFVDDLVGLVIGPLFVVAELGFLLSLGEQVRQQIEQRVGPTLIRQHNVKSA